LSHPIVYIRRT